MDADEKVWEQSIFIVKKSMIVDQWKKRKAKAQNNKSKKLPQGASEFEIQSQAHGRS